MSQANPSPDWKQFEELVAMIHRQLSPGATVTENETIIGTSGTPHDFEIVIRQKVGLLEVKIVVECRYKSRPVPKSEVAAFVATARDVDAYGMMVSKTGFQSGARTLAKHHGIQIYTLKQALEVDWKALIGSWNASILRVASGFYTANLAVQYDDPSLTFEQNLNTILYNADGQPIATFRDFLNQLRDGPLSVKNPSLKVGRQTCTVVFNNPIFVRSNEGIFCRVHRFTADCDVQARIYNVPVRIAVADVLRDEQTTEAKYVLAKTHYYDILEIEETIPFTLLTQEELDDFLQNKIGKYGATGSGSKPFHMDISFHISPKPTAP